MKALDEVRAERLVHVAAGSLNPASLWFVATCVPDRKALLNFDPVLSAEIQDWVCQEAGNWPAPLRVGDNLSEQLHDDKLVFSPPLDGSLGPAHYVQLQTDGSCLIAVQIGNLKEAGGGQGNVWAIGEGAIAWLSVAFVRFAAAWAGQAGVLGSGFIDLRIFSSAPQEDQTDLQLWSFASGTNAPTGEARQMTQPCHRSLDLTAGLTGDVTLIARSLLLPLLAQLGQQDSRHIDAAGGIRVANFVGHAPLIEAWARSIGATYI